MSAQEFAIPADLANCLAAAHPFTAAIVCVGLHVDERLNSMDRAALRVLAAEAHEGRPDVSLGTLSRTLERCDATVRDAVRRLSWAGYAYAETRPAGPIATTRRLRMPFDARWGAPIPRSAAALSGRDRATFERRGITIRCRRSSPSRRPAGLRSSADK